MATPDIEELNLQGTIRVVQLFDRRHYPTKPVAYAMVTEHARKLVLWFIYTDQHYRRRGYGRQLLRFLQSTCDEIRTQINIREGNKLCLSTDFVKEAGWIIWRKPTGGIVGHL